MKNIDTKIIFVLGGLFSGIGKGIVASSVAKLFKLNGLKVSMQKQDPYLNIDCGLMSPKEHGEVFITKDGLETDLDLGNYERFLNQTFTNLSSVTSGQIYQEILSNERQGFYKGKTINIYDVSEKIQSKIFNIIDKEQCDCLVVELGGTIGDNDSKPFLIAAAQIQRILGSGHVCFIFLTYISFFDALNEFKTKPAQNSIALLRSNAIEPNFVILRSNHLVPHYIEQKIAKFCYLSEQQISALSNINIYQTPLVLLKNGLFNSLLRFFGFNNQVDKSFLEAWWEKIQLLETSKKSVKIAIINKYPNFKQSYLSLYQAFYVASVAANIKFEYEEIDPEAISDANVAQLLTPFNGLFVPGGFGVRGSEGKMRAIQFAREHNLPFFGVCLGMQLAALEFATNVIKIPNVTSEEFVDQAAKNSNFIIKFADPNKQMFAGERSVLLDENSLAFKCYQKNLIFERHRHRLIFNDIYKQKFVAHGMSFTGVINDAKETVEVLEISKHPFFLATQFHPELSSCPEKPHPLFINFFNKVYQLKKK